MAANLGESRTDLLNWLNSTLDLNYTKVEQCGTGAAYCQIMDSIYGDVPMHRVSFTAKFDYEYLLNYKILQSLFAKHGVSKTVPVERLLKCKLQDNLEFLQWLKRFWMETKDESEYEPTSRRKGGGGTKTDSRTGSSINNRVGLANKKGASSMSSRPRVTPPVSNAPKYRGLVGTTKPTMSAGATGSSRLFGSNSSVTSVKPKAGTSQQSAKLQKDLEQSQLELGEISQELNEYKDAAEGLETERNFYFSKLRDIEILSQAITDQLSEEAEKQHQQQLSGGELSSDVLSNNQSLIEFVEKIQDILYSTEEGFQVPNQDEEANGDEQLMDEESF